MGDCNPEKSLSRKIDCYCHWDLEEEEHHRRLKPANMYCCMRLKGSSTPKLTFLAISFLGW